MEQPVSDKNTKAQILDAYEKLLKKVEEKSNDNPKEVQQRKQDTQTVSDAGKTSGEKIAEQIAKIKSEFVGSLDAIETKLTNERKKLETIQSAIQIEEKRLNELYGLTSNADALSAILLAQKEQKEKFELEMAERKDELTAIIAETRAEWEKEQKNYNENLKAEKETIAKLRKREEDEYTYSTQLKRKQEQDEYAQKKIRQETELKEQKTVFEKEVAEREKALLASETELEQLRAGTQNFSQKLSETIEQTRTETETRLQTVYGYEKELREKEVQGLLALKEHQIKTLEAKIKDMETQMKEAAVKVDVSEKTVKDIALKAIENANKTQVIERERIKE